LNGIYDSSFAHAVSHDASGATERLPSSEPEAESLPGRRFLRFWLGHTKIKGERVRSGRCNFGDWRMCQAAEMFHDERLSVKASKVFDLLFLAGDDVQKPLLLVRLLGSLSSRLPSAQTPKRRRWR
jgi:hypothetical protein